MRLCILILVEHMKCILLFRCARTTDERLNGWMDACVYTSRSQILCFSALLHRREHCEFIGFVYLFISVCGQFKRALGRRSTFFSSYLYKYISINFFSDWKIRYICWRRRRRRRRAHQMNNCLIFQSVRDSFDERSFMWILRSLVRRRKQK